MLNQQQLQELGRRQAEAFEQGAQDAGLIEKAETPPPPAAPAVEEQRPYDDNDVVAAPQGGWWSPEARLMAQGWKPRLVDGHLAEVLMWRETLRWTIRDLVTRARNAPDQVFAALLAKPNDAAGLAAEIHASAIDGWLQREVDAQDSGLQAWSWRHIEEARLERLWRFAPAILRSLENFTGPDADWLRADVARIQGHPYPPKPTVANVIRR